MYYTFGFFFTSEPNGNIYKKCQRKYKQTQDKKLTPQKCTFTSVHITYPLTLYLPPPRAKYGVSRTSNIRGKMVHLLDLTRTRYWYEVVWWYLGSLSNIACEPWVEHFMCPKGTRLCVGHAPFPKTNSSTISRGRSHKVAINRFLLHMFFAKVLDLHVISSI